jgi:hypothetical protein
MPTKSDRQHELFWRDIIYKDGKLDEEQVMKELIDYSDMMDRFVVFLCEATGNRMSKLNYTTGEMLSCLNQHIEDCVERALEDAKEDEQAE